MLRVPAGVGVLLVVPLSARAQGNHPSAPLRIERTFIALRNKQGARTTGTRTR